MTTKPATTTGVSRTLAKTFERSTSHRYTETLTAAGYTVERPDDRGVPYLCVTRTQEG